MVNIWRKLNFLVPKPKCRLEEVNGVIEIVKWHDTRPQPTDSDIAAVVEQDVIDSELITEQEEKFNQDIIKAIGLTMKDFMNEIIGGRNTDITNAELKTKFKSYL